MKTITKLFIYTLGIYFFGCSSDSSNSGNDENNNNGDTPIIIKYMTFMSDGDDSATISYSNGLINSFNDQGAKYNIVLNAEKKVTEATNQHGEKLTFLYSNGKLDKLIHSFTDGTPSWEDKFSYGSNGQIISIVENADDGYDESSYYTYDSSGNMITRQIGVSGSIYTFEFDNKNNPFYPIWKDFGFLIDLEDDVYDIVPMFSMHNPTKIYRNGELRLEVIYTYNSDGYPTVANYTNSSGGNGNVVYQYQN